MNELVKDLLEALKGLMAAEGGEPGATEEQQEAWELAVAVIAHAERAWEPWNHERT